MFEDCGVAQKPNNNNVTAQIVRDGNIGGILSRTTTAGAAFYGYDGNGNVTLLTNSAGQDIGHYRYDAFGNTRSGRRARAKTRIASRPRNCTGRAGYTITGLGSTRRVWGVG